jgi:hypothetical protein
MHRNAKIAEWLEKLGMSEYAQRFVESGIDVSVLGYLTDQDLEKIGVLLGHRRKILAAIERLITQIDERYGARTILRCRDQRYPAVGSSQDSSRLDRQAELGLGS